MWILFERKQNSGWAKTPIEEFLGLEKMLPPRRLAESKPEYLL